MRLVFGLASAFKDDKERDTVTKRLASKVGVAAKAVNVGCCTEGADALQDTAVTIGPLPTAEVDDVAAQLRACTSDLAKTGRLLQIDVKRMSDPTLETCRWSFCEQVLHAAVSAVNVTFVGPKNCQSRLERSANSFFKEDGDLALRPHVLLNALLFRERRDGEACTFEGKPLSESYATVQAMVTDSDARSRIPELLSESYATVQAMITDFNAPKRILENAHRVLNTAIERCTEASDIANVRVGAQTAAHSAVADDAEAEARKGEELAPHMVHCAVLDRHDQHEGQVLDGLSAMCRSERLTTYVDPVNIAPDGEMLNDGERKDDPLVMQRGNFALDDYGTPCRHNLLSPRTVASPHVTSCPVPPRRERRRGVIPVQLALVHSAARPHAEPERQSTPAAPPVHALHQPLRPVHPVTPTLWQCRPPARNQQGRRHTRGLAPGSVCQVPGTRRRRGVPE